jgi:uncharacterized protein
MSKKSENPHLGKFGWNELVTSSVPGAKKFYTSLLGWKTKPFGKGNDYTLFMHGKDMAGGLMKSPKPGMPPMWVPYVVVKNVDAYAKKAKKLGARIAMPPFDVPDAGRIAVLVDPQGAIVGLFQPNG